MDNFAPRKQIPALRLRNSTATSVLLPSKLSNSAAAAVDTSSSSSTSRTTSSSSSSSQSFSTIEFEISPNPNATSYTSLKDLLPSTAVQSPTPSAAASGIGGALSGYEISIRNRLVKQAAWAYLQPMSVSPDAVGRSFVHRIWIRFSNDLVNSPFGTFFRRVIGFLARALCGILRAVSR